LLDGVTGKTQREFHFAVDKQLIADVLFDGRQMVCMVLGRPFYSAGKLRYGAPVIRFFNLKTEAGRQVSLEGEIYLPRAVYFTEEGRLQVGCKKGLYQITF